MRQFTRQIIVAALALGFVGAVGAWTGNSQVPPAGNTPAPINVGGAIQSKQGTLGVKGLGVFGKALISPTSGYSIPSNINLGVNGAVGANEYCDELGQNCVAITGIVAASTVTRTPPPPPPPPGFGGSYRSSPYGGCAEGNSFTGSCSCPAGFYTVPVYSYSWYPEGWSSVQSFCLR